MSGPDTLTASGVFWWADQSAGWIYLLPPLAERHMLCVDPPPELAWLLNRSCRRVTISYSSADAATYSGKGQAEAVFERTDWVPLERILGDSTASPLEATRRFDGLLIHDPQARVIHSLNTALIHRLVEALPRLLSPDAFVYMGVRRRWSLFRIPDDPRAPPGSRAASSFGSVARRLRRGGFDLLTCQPMLLDGSRVVDIVTAGYRASTNGALWRERAKELLLGPAGSRIFAPACGWLATSAATARPIVEDVAQLVCGVVGARANELRLTQYRLARGDKAILGFENVRRPEAAAIAVVSEDPSVIRGRRIESAILERIAQLPDHLSSMVPRHLGEFQVGRYTCFLITLLPGVTLDMEARSLDALTAQAMEFLKALHVRTAEPTFLSSAALDQHVGSIIDDAIFRNPDLTESFESLRVNLLRVLRGRTLSTVFTHGDYKIENVMYARADGRITGIIDWEHAIPAALPLLDTLYLLFYNRILRGAAWADALESVVDLSKLDEGERMSIDDYLAAIGTPVSLYAPLAALFLAHHIGRRITLQVESATTEHLRRILIGLDSRILDVPAESYVPSVT